MKKYHFLFLVLFVSSSFLPLQAQKLEFLNSYWYSIQDTSKYSYTHYRIIIEDDFQKSVRIFTKDSTLVYQLLEKYAQKKQPMTWTKVWYDDSGIKTRSEIYTEKKKRKETTQFFKNGERKSFIITQNDQLLEEIYFSEIGEEIPKPQLIQASPVGGIEGWNMYLGKNLIYPEDARFLGEEGTVYLHFYVSEEGKIEDIEIMNPEENHPSLNKEAFRVVSAYPYHWSPSKENGITKKSEARLPIRFKLTD